MTTKLEHVASDLSCWSPAQDVPIASKWGESETFFWCWLVKSGWGEWDTLQSGEVVWILVTGDHTREGWEDWRVWFLFSRIWSRRVTWIICGDGSTWRFLRYLKLHRYKIKPLPLPKSAAPPGVSLESDIIYIVSHPRNRYSLCQPHSSQTVGSRKCSLKYSWLSVLTVMALLYLNPFSTGLEILGPAGRQAELWVSFTGEQFNSREPGAHESEGQLNFVTVKPVATNFEAILSTSHLNLKWKHGTICRGVQYSFGNCISIYSFWKWYSQIYILTTGKFLLVPEHEICSKTFFFF